MKRLGMWNRLAVVAIALTTLIAPTWFIVSERTRMVEVAGNGYSLCLKAAFAPGGDGSITPESCSQTWFPDDKWYPGWLEWWQAAGFVLLLCVVAYLLLWGAISTAKWIWRGRQVG